MFYQSFIGSGMNNTRMERYEENFGFLFLTKGKDLSYKDKLEVFFYNWIDH